MLQKAEILDFEKIPESRKKISVWELEGAPVRIGRGIGRGTHPTERAFYRAFRDFNPLNDLGIG